MQTAFSPPAPSDACPSASLLLVEDDERLTRLMVRYFAQHGFHLASVRRGDQAVAACRQLDPALVLLDLMLPGASGIEVCRQIRRFSSVPILMLTACGEDVDQIGGLDAGADDYVVKPVEPPLLLARVRALLRRRTLRPEEDGRRVLGGLVIDRERREVLLDGQVLELTTSEFEVLWCLASAAGRIMSRDEILRQVRGVGFDGLDRSIDVCIGRLRRKLGDDPRDPARIKTVWGRGYLFAAAEA